MKKDGNYMVRKPAITNYILSSLLQCGDLIKLWKIILKKFKHYNITHVTIWRLYSYTFEDIAVADRLKGQFAVRVQMEAIVFKTIAVILRDFNIISFVVVGFSTGFHCLFAIRLTQRGVLSRTSFPAAKMTAPILLQAWPAC